MRYLVLSDIHSNLQALEAVLKEAGQRGYDRVLVLGDLVGYGAEPNAVIDLVRSLAPAAIVRGNHDKVCAGVEDAGGFNRVARLAAEWTSRRLTAENAAYLASLPEGPALVGETLEICHGAPRDEDAYIVNDLEALRALEESERPVCIFGHTHIPCAFRLAGGVFTLLLRGAHGDEKLPLEAGASYLINPGSVGQPRDGDARAAYALLNLSGETACSWFRVHYAVEEAQVKVLEAGLPASLADRLAVGR